MRCCDYVWFSRNRTNPPWHYLFSWVRFEHWRCPYEVDLEYSDRPKLKNSFTSHTKEQRIQLLTKSEAARTPPCSGWYASVDQSVLRIHSANRQCQVQYPLKWIRQGKLKNNETRKMLMQLPIATNYNLIRTKSGWIISTKEKMWPKKGNRMEWG